MGDIIRIVDIQFLDYSKDVADGRKLYQIDLYNETKNEHYRVFSKSEKLEEMLAIAKGKKYESVQKNGN